MLPTPAKREREREVESTKKKSPARRPAHSLFSANLPGPPPPAISSSMRAAWAAALLGLCLVANAAPPPPLLVPLTAAAKRGLPDSGALSALKASPGTAAIALASFSPAALSQRAMTLPLGGAVPPAPSGWAKAAAHPAALTLTRSRLERTAPPSASLTWIGYVAGGVPGVEPTSPTSEAVITVVDGAVAGSVRAGGRVWALTTVAPGASAAGGAGAVVALVAMNSSAMPPLDPPAPVLPPSGNKTAVQLEEGRTGWAGDALAHQFFALNKPLVASSSSSGPAAPPRPRPPLPNPPIRVMFLYTNATLDAAGGSDAFLRALAAYSIASANVGLDNSGIPPAVARFEWVGGATLVPEADEAIGTLPLLERLNNPTDGHFDWAFPGLWKAQAADAVVMFAELTDWGGIAYTPGARVGQPAVLVRGVLAFFYAVLHELAHLVGCLHDVETSRENWPELDAHGYRARGGRPPYRTVMAYSCRPPEPECPEVNVFSNPALTLDGVATGITGEANNARVFTQNAWWLAYEWETWAGRL